MSGCGSDSGSNIQSNRIYEFNAPTGNLTAIAGDTTGTKFRLTFANMKNVINWFSDRPIREAGTDTIDNLINSVWPAYGSVTPNAVLEAFYGTRQYIQIFGSLENPVYDAATGRLSFGITVNYVEGNQGSLSNLGLADLQLLITNNASSTNGAQWSELLYGESLSFQKAADGTYTLNISNAFEDVYGYTSAPVRNRMKTLIKDYLGSWQAHFGNNPPNAAVISTDSHNAVRLQIVTLSSPVYNETTKSISFQATPVYGAINAGEVLTDAELFIDGADGVQFTVNNATSKTIYVYNYPSGTPEITTPYTLSAGKSLQLPLRPNDQSRPPLMRIYIADARLSNSIEKGKAPDPFNYGSDAAVLDSFAEYTYEPEKSRYTVDVSYVDEFSYPLTVKFSDVPDSYTGCVDNFEYGFTSLATVKENLRKQADYRWDALIWPAQVETYWDNGKYPPNMDRIIGPSKVWGMPNDRAKSHDDQHKDRPWVPFSYDAFYDSLPSKGMQLFNTISNNDGWQSMTFRDNPGPLYTGYTKALHLAAKADKNGKYGFYAYPKDDDVNVFDNVPGGTKCAITVYPYNN